MIRQLYTLIGKAFENEDYSQVIELVDKALEIPEFGFNMNIIYKYGYSLLKVHRGREGMHILEFIVNNETNPGALEKTIETIKLWKKRQSIKLPIERYLNKGYKLKEGLVVYLELNEEIESIVPLSDINTSYLYLIWRIENGKVYAFPVKKHKSHGYILSASKYFRETDLAAVPTLVSFGIENISKVSMKLDKNDYINTINDLYQRYCIFGTISNKPKNYFVQEQEKSLQISIGDVIAVYDSATRSRFYYSIIDIDTERSMYKAFRIGHMNGEIYIKDQNVEEIPFTAYITEKAVISLENQRRLNEEMSSIFDTNKKR